MRMGYGVGRFDSRNKCSFTARYNGWMDGWVCQILCVGTELRIIFVGCGIHLHLIIITNRGCLYKMLNQNQAIPKNQFKQNLVLPIYSYTILHHSLSVVRRLVQA